MLTDFENYLKINLGAKNSIDTYVYRMRDFFNSFKNFTQENVNAYLAGLVDKKLSASTFNLSMIACKHYARFQKIEIQFPKQKKCNKKARTFVTMEELEEELFPYFSLLFPADYEKRQLILRFVFVTGLRISEVVNLKKNDFNFGEKGMISITDTKGKVDRQVFIPALISEDIQKEFSKHSTKENAFDVTQDYIKWIFQKINTELNYKKRLSPHVLRHASAKFMLRNGMPITDLQKFLGHKDLKTTEIYIKATDEEVKESYFRVIKKYKKGRKKK